MSSINENEQKAIESPTFSNKNPLNISSFEYNEYENNISRHFESQKKVLNSIGPFRKSQIIDSENIPLFDSQKNSLIRSPI